ncbi:hypothetical protein L1887_40708 [Cichorium endivia]|nr:hypothetical protein L1887_40708 [Cichorium endivia]
MSSSSSISHLQNPLSVDYRRRLDGRRTSPDIPDDVVEEMKEDIEEMKNKIEVDALKMRKEIDEMKHTFDLALRKIMVDRAVDSVAVRKNRRRLRKKFICLVYESLFCLWGL